MTKTYVPISTTTLGSNASTVSFSSIPGTYTDLVIVMGVISTSNTGHYVYLQYNGDTGSNYSTTILTGTGSSAVSTRFNGRTPAFQAGCESSILFTRSRLKINNKLRGVEKVNV